MEAREAWHAYLALLFGTFVTIEAAAFQAPALPSVTAHFGIPVNLAALILILYFLGLTVFAPIMGRLGDQLGRKRIVSIGLVIFALAEFVAAAAPNFATFLAARFFQGFGVACILPTVFAYVRHLFAEHQRGLALGIFTVSMTFGAATGGLLGGLLIDHFGWPSVYWISGALALAGLIPVRMLVPEVRSTQVPGRFDLRGACYLFLTIAALLSFPTWVANFGLGSTYSWLIAAIGLASLVALWRNSTRTPSPVIDTTVLKRPAFGLPCAIYWLHMLSFSGIVYALAFFINNRPGGTASQFGFVLLVLYGSSMLSAPLAGRAIDRVDPRNVSVFALTGTLVALLALLRVDAATALWFITLIACLLGLMMGCNTPAVMKLAIAAVPQEKTGAGTGLFSMVRDLGSPTGSSLVLAVFGTSLAYYTTLALQRIGEQLDLAGEALTQFVEAAARPSAEIPAPLSQRLDAVEVDLAQAAALAHSSGLSAALTNVGYLLIATIGLALVLAVRLRMRR